MTLLGWVSGMSLLHLIMISVVADRTEFLQMYSRFAILFNGLFLLLSKMCLVFGITICFIYRQKSKAQLRSLDAYRHKLRMHYNMSVLISGAVGISMILLYILPSYTIPLHYL